MAFTVQTTLIAGFTPEFQLWIDRTLLEHVVQLTVFEQFAMQGTLPGGAGATQARFLVQGAGAFTNVQTLTEGTPISVSRGLSLTAVTPQLVQYGEVIVVSDILLKTQLIDTLKFATQTLGEDCALQMDQIQSTVIGNMNVAGDTRYAQQITSFANLVAATNAGGSAVINDFLDAMTRLEIQRAPRIDGDYVAVICPQIRRDVLKDQTFLTPAMYADTKRIFKGEIGEFFGVRFVLTTNPWIENTGAQFTYNAAGTIFTSVVTGKQGWGFIKLAAMDPNLSASEQSPASPKIYMVNGADHIDPLAQQVIIGWKAFTVATLMSSTNRPNWCVTVRSKTQYA